MKLFVSAVVGALSIVSFSAVAQSIDSVAQFAKPNPTPSYAQWKNGPPADEHYFPIAVWLQNPVVHDKPEVAGKLGFVGKGVERLVRWTSGQKAVWNCIECTHISNPKAKATPEQVRSEVWMALIHGSRGLIYFVHQFKPAFKEAALLDDSEMLRGITEINRQVHELAPVLNSPNVLGEATVHGSASGASIAWMMKRRGDAVYLFTVNMRNEPARGAFAIRGLPESVNAEVLGESRSVAVRNGEFSDEFEAYAVHLYRVQPSKPD